MAVCSTRFTVLEDKAQFKNSIGNKTTPVPITGAT